jgi:SPP1 gp7 family putative phage head morphogenesis protein
MINDKRIIEKLKKGIRKKPSKWLFPINVEKEYISILVNYFKEMNKLIDTLFFNQIKNSQNLFNYIRPNSINQDAFPSDIERMINTISLQLDKNWKVDPNIITFNIGKKAAQYNEVQWLKIQQSIFGVQLFQNEPWLNPILESFTKDNVALIKSLKDKKLTELQLTLNSEFKKGTLYSDIKELVQNKYKNTEWQAERIARDQIGKLNADLTEYRQKEIGVKKYTWRTSLDERVRGNPLGKFPKAIPSHWDREGKIFDWNTPPEEGHPGQAILCRCYAEPDFNSIDLNQENENEFFESPKTLNTQKNKNKNELIDFSNSENNLFKDKNFSKINELIKFDNNIPINKNLFLIADSDVLKIGSERLKKYNDIFKFNLGPDFFQNGFQDEINSAFYVKKSSTNFPDNKKNKIFLNKHLRLNSLQFNNDLKKQMELGIICKTKNSIKGTIDHEFGHHLYEQLDNEFKDDFKNYLIDLNYDIEELKKGSACSFYSLKNHDELFAESISDVFNNGVKAHETSIKIFEKFTESKLYKGIK